ncbi:MAG: BTAD domain-containing putative transcriptional regulator [Acidimicrobiia bacterium]
MISTAPSLQFLLLGPPRILVDGVPLHVDTRKALALAFYLVVHAHEPTRDELVSLLWPELDKTRGRAALRRTMSALRTGLGGGGLLADRDRVRLDLNGARLDISEAEALSRITHDHTTDQVCPECASNLGEAVSLYRGSFLDGFYLRDAADFEEWHRSEAELHRRNWRELVSRWGLALASAGRFADAEAAVRRRLVADALDEVAHRQVMQFLVWSGDRVGALRQYRECAAVLDRELGVSPLPETRQLYEMIMEGVEPLPPTGRVEMMPVVRERALAPDLGPTIGREGELDQMTASVGSIVLEGDEGIGKSRLIDAWLETLALPVARASATPGVEGVPYLAIRDLLISAMPFAAGNPPSIAAEAVRLLPQLADAGFPQPEMAEAGPGAAAQFHAGIVASLHHLLEGGWLVVDDAHWLDPSSVAILNVFLTHPEPKGARLILSWRQDEVDATQPFSVLLRRLERDGEIERIRLGPLAEESARRLLESRPGPPLAPADAAAIVARAQGNPLFLISYRDAAGSDRADLPRDLERLIESRLERLGEESWQVLSAASVLGSEAETDLLRSVSGRGDEEMVTAIEELISRGLMIENQNGVAFAHDAVRRAVVQRLSKARTRILHSRAADAMTQATQTASRAWHLEAAGRSSESAAAHFEAGREAIELHAYEAGSVHLRAAAALGYADRDRLGLLLGDAAVRLGDYGAALAAYATVTEGPEVEFRIGGVYLRLRRWALAQASLERAAALDPPPELATHITADRAVVAHHQGDDVSADQLAKLARDQAKARGDIAGLAQAANLAGMLAPQPQVAITRLKKANAIANDTGRPELVAATLNNLGLAHRAAGDLEAAIAAGEAALAVLERVGDRHQLAALHNNLADTLHQAGRSNLSRAHVTESVRLFADVGLEPGTFEPEIWKLSEW